MKNNLDPKSLRTDKERDSNMELFRVVAMFLVMVVHAGFISIGYPQVEDLEQSALNTTARLFFQSLSIGCVDMFVLISGWFGIRPKAKSFWNFMSQCLFFLIGIYLISIAAGRAQLSWGGVRDCFALGEWDWFIKAYLGLYILAPALNAYLEKATERQVRMLIVYFYVFQSIYAWISMGATFFEMGYSTMSLIGLYMLGRYVRLYPSKWMMRPAKIDFLVFLGIAVLLTVAALLSIENRVVFGKVYYYTNPLVVLMSLYFMLGFTKLRFRSRLVNWLGISSFAVYLVHFNVNVYQDYKMAVKMIYDRLDGVLCLVAIGAFLVALFVVSVLADKVRLALWWWLWGKVERRGSQVPNG